MQKAFTLNCKKCDGDDLLVRSVAFNDLAVVVVAVCSDCATRLVKIFSFAELYRRGGAA
jgi:hypothetical protein